MRTQQIELWHTAYPAQYDEHLGWSLQPGATRTAADLGVPVSITQDGVRSNGQPAPAAGPAILALGDSFTFGDEAGDNCTWPAQLERDLGKPVINGGVFGYGFDQIVLRAEQLAAREKYTLLIVSIIDDDIERCEMSCRTAWKPYFEIDGDGLILRNDPVPKTAVAKASRVKTALGYSYLMNFICKRAAREWWAAEGDGMIRVHARGMDVALRLTARIAELQRARGSRVLLVAQGRLNGDPQRLVPVLTRAREAGLETLDLVAPLNEVLRADPGKRAEFFTTHMTCAGNAWVAARIAEKLRTMQP